MDRDALPPPPSTQSSPGRAGRRQWAGAERSGVSDGSGRGGEGGLRADQAVMRTIQGDAVPSPLQGREYHSARMSPALVTPTTTAAASITTAMTVPSCPPLPVTVPSTVTIVTTIATTTFLGLPP